MLDSTPPLPSWITDKGGGRYTVDVKAAMAAGEELPIKLYKIPQFAPFFTSPPTQRGTIDFENYHQLSD